jgi:integrase
MSVRKRKWTTRSGEVREAWIVDYAQEGHRRIETFKRKKDADDYANTVGVDIRAGTHTPLSRSITVREAAEDWLRAAELNNLERATVASYRQIVSRHIVPRLGKHKLASLSTPKIHGFVDALLADGVSRAMTRKVLVSLKSLVSDARRPGAASKDRAGTARPRLDRDDTRHLRPPVPAWRRRCRAGGGRTQAARAVGATQMQHDGILSCNNNGYSQIYHLLGMQ